MLLPRLQPALRGTQSTCLNEAFAQLAIRGPALSFMRHASHAQQGAVNKAKDGPGKRLGAKKSGEQYVIPGNIIFRQRGTHWFPGENCAMGRDHTIYATECGYVKYYKDPEKHPKRQYIGVVFERNQVLPLPRNAVRRRRLNMLAQKRELQPEIENLKTDRAIQSNGKKGVDFRERKRTVKRQPLKIKEGYMFREANWEIGRAAERAKVQVRAFKPRDRWLAWQKTTARKEANKAKRIVGGKKKK